MEGILHSDKWEMMCCGYPPLSHSRQAKYAKLLNNSKLNLVKLKIFRIFKKGEATKEKKSINRN